MKKETVSRYDLLDTLFFISSCEMAKPEKKINVPLILQCTEESGLLDPRYRSDAAERASFAETVKRRASSDTPPAGEPAHAGRLSKKAVMILVAAAILVITALTAAAIATDLFGLFFDDPREALEWEEGESRRIGDYEMIISFKIKEYDSVEDLKNDFGDRFIFPSEPPEGYEVSEIYYLPFESMPEITIKYENGGKAIQYTVFPGRSAPTQEELDNSGYETIISQHGSAFRLMDSTKGYQVVARVGNDLYIVDSAEKEDLIAFIKNSEEL